ELRHTLPPPDPAYTIAELLGAKASALMPPPIAGLEADQAPALLVLRYTWLLPPANRMRLGSAGLLGSKIIGVTHGPPGKPAPAPAKLAPPLVLFTSEPFCVSA